MDEVLSVSDFLRLANEVLRLNIQNGAFAIEGEISGYSVKDGKWIIFSLKDEVDEKSKLKCFATVYKVAGSFEDGMRVRVWGGPSIKPWSDFQLDVQRMEPVGEGALKRAYELLKLKLEQEGIFALARKRSIPKFPDRIGLITSSDAAAYGDFLRILNNRWSGVKVIHADVRVQGKDAVDHIISAFDYFNGLGETDRPDVIVLTRGGGSLEDLHAFNDERVVRAVYGSSIPVVCGVGHERDESLCDYAADVRASTPSNAAERIVPDRRDVEYTIKMMVERVGDTLHRRLDDRGQVIQTAERVMAHFLEGRKREADNVIQRLLLQTNSWILSIRQRIDSEERLLRNVDPTRILSRGYSIVKSGTKVIKDAKTLAAGDEITVQFARGTVDAEVK
ncbi:MAG: exodeoxyribonuclease VII large subunit [Patescibacteria group bacterium]